MPDKIGIVLVNYKDYARKFLNACRDSLRSQDSDGYDYKVYIVDNSSSDESLKFLKENYPEAKVIPRLDGNYAAANNLGFSQAKTDGCGYLVSLNMDTEVDTKWLKELIAPFKSEENVGIVQSKILLYSGSRETDKIARINSLGNVVNFLGFGFTTFYDEPDRELNVYMDIKGYASGCSFAIRSSVWQEIGGYCEDLYMYHDDLDISLKARLAGYRIILAPKSLVWHKYEFSRSTKMVYYMERNRLFFLLAFYPYYLLLLILAPAIIMELGLFAFSLIRGWWPAKIKADLYFLNPINWFKIRRYRHHLRTISKVSFKNIAKDFSGKIEFKEIANPLLSYVANPILDIYWRLVKKII